MISIDNKTVNHTIQFKPSSIHVMFGSELSISMEGTSGDNFMSTCNFIYDYKNKIQINKEKSEINTLSIEVNNAEYPALVKQFIVSIQHHNLIIRFNTFVELNLSDVPYSFSTLSIVDYEGCMPIDYLNHLIGLLKDGKIKLELKILYPKKLLILEDFEAFDGIVVHLEDDIYQTVKQYHIMRAE